MTSTTPNEDPRYEPLFHAMGMDAVEFLETGPYLDAVKESLARGLTAQEIYLAMSRELGEGRHGLVLRCYQAARHMEPDFNKPQDMSALVPETAPDITYGTATMRPVGRGRAG